jgi:beta-ureidopropionase / N-carbamoyl-L-amino-acid hydrolase
VAEVTQLAIELGGTVTEESWSEATAFPEGPRVAALLDGAPILDTGAGHDAGILARAGVPAAMLFVRNPTGVSHSPAEHAERDDCLAGVAALATVIETLAG